jgi:multidrug efflux pump subunit AcrA (membrane-fusion protein)
MKQKLTHIQATAKNSIRAVYKRITRTILTYPERSFFGVLGVLFLFIIVGSFLSKPKIAKTTTEVTPKQIRVYSIGSAPRIQVAGQVETSGVVKIVAQSGGIVQKVYTQAGSKISQGDWIAWLSTNYQGGTIPTTTREIAQKNYDFVTANYDAQNDIISRQRSVADSAQSQAADMRTITNNSISDTQGLVSLNQDIVNTLKSQVDSLVSTGASDTLILQARQGLAGAQAGLNSLKVALSNAQYQASADNAPAHLANAQHDLAIAQLDLQKKSLDLNRELAQLNLNVAQISESLMYPSSPVSGTVERVYVLPGQNVSAGAVLATITANTRASTVVAMLPEGTAKNISRLEKSKIIVGTTSIDVYPRYISTQPTDGSLYSVIYSIPPEFENVMANGSSVIVELPIGSAESTSAVPYVPLDAIYQTQSESYVYIASPSASRVLEAKSKKVHLGSVYGQYVEVDSGLAPNDQVITTRNVVEGDVLTLE